MGHAAEKKSATLPSKGDSPDKLASYVAGKKTSRNRRIAAAAVLSLVVIITVAISVPLVMLKQEEEAWVAQRAAPVDSEILPALFVQFDSCSALASQLRLYPGANAGSEVQLSERYRGGGFRGGPIMDGMVPLMEDSMRASPGAAGGSATSAGAADYSSTNVQVAGIDEADLVKNDGTFIYSVGGSELVIVRAYPAELRAVVSRTSLRATAATRESELFAGEEMLLAGTTLVVLAAVQLSSEGRRFAAVVAQTWDVSDAQVPTLLRAVTLEGTLATARLIGDFAYARHAETGAHSSSSHWAPRIMTLLPPSLERHPHARAVRCAGISPSHRRRTSPPCPRCRRCPPT